MTAVYSRYMRIMRRAKTQKLEFRSSAIMQRVGVFKNLLAKEL
jgi:hypothetical protein